MKAAEDPSTPQDIASQLKSAIALRKQYSELASSIHLIIDAVNGGNPAWQWCKRNPLHTEPKEKLDELSKLLKANKSVVMIMQCPDIMDLKKRGIAEYKLIAAITSFEKVLEKPLPKLDEKYKKLMRQHDLENESGSSYFSSQ